MIPQLTPEQREYKERTLNQLQANHVMLEKALETETRPNVVKSIQKQLTEIEDHINRLQDELSGEVVFDEPVADELFKKAATALSKEKFFLAKRYISKLEVIEPFYPGLDRLKHEADSQRVTRRTRSIAAGTASGYPVSSTQPVPAIPGSGTELETAAASGFAPEAGYYTEEEPSGRFGQLFQFHVVLSCLVILVLLCIMFGIGGFMMLQWLVEGA